MNKQQIETILANYQDPYLATDLLSSGAIKNIASTDESLTLDIELGFPAKHYQIELKNNLQKELEKIAEQRKIIINISWEVSSHAVQSGVQGLKGVKNIIAIASAKGGVGKSTTAVNLALALHQQGASVGIVDADIYGPSQPTMLGLSGQRPESHDGRTLEPIVSYGLQSMSIGYLVDQEAAIAWRGPMATKALRQLLFDTNWRDLDYLIVDLPPGTGDIHLSLSQKIPVSGAVIVTTPQDIALLDARRGIELFSKVKISVLGLVENMSLHVCSECGHTEEIFGSGGGESLAQKYHVPLLGKLPLAKQIREDADSGKPTVVADPEGELAAQYIAIALKMAAKLSLHGRDYSAKFPNIVIE